MGLFVKDLNMKKVNKVLRFTGKNDSECIKFCPVARDPIDTKANLIISTKNGDVLCNIDDYIVKFEDNTFDVFNGVTMNFVNPSEYNDFVAKSLNIKKELKREIKAIITYNGENKDECIELCPKAKENGDELIIPTKRGEESCKIEDDIVIFNDGTYEVWCRLRLMHDDIIVKELE